VINLSLSRSIVVSPYLLSKITIESTTAGNIDDAMVLPSILTNFGNGTELAFNFAGADEVVANVAML